MNEVRRAGRRIEVGCSVLSKSIGLAYILEMEGRSRGDIGVESKRNETEGREKQLLTFDSK